jgi:hypothetical protein
MARTVDDKRWTAYVRFRNAGDSVAAAARQAGISREAARGYEQQLPGSSGRDFRERNNLLNLRDVVPLDQLRPEARLALDDFDYFRRRYLGRYSRPWMVQSAARIVELLETDEKEFVVINVCPGTGKTTLFTCDIPLWLICRNRALRSMVGSSAESLARKHTNRVRRELMRTIPLRPPDDQRQAGAVNAESTLAEDFGRFQPNDRELWRADQFVVQQYDGDTISEKEPTMAAYGWDSDYLGNRLDFIMWDDLVTSKFLRNTDVRDAQREKWDNEAETRLEPGGLMCLQGQRMGADDLYRYCIDKAVDVFDDEDDEDASGSRPLYTHIVFPAHDEDRCEGKHRRPRPERPHKDDAHAWPDGCLIDPIRVPWRDLSSRMRNAPSTYRVQYQQEDVNPDDVLVQKLWVSGGTDDAGVTYYGAWDHKRGLGELPKGRLDGTLISLATADPSPTMYWSVQWWAVLLKPDRTFGPRFLIDHVRRKMQAPEFLDKQGGEYVGIADEWQLRSRDMNLPIRYWIVEKNAAQRFMLQYQFARDWQRDRGVHIIGHETGRNKSDPEYGVWALGPLWRDGLVRLPNNGGAAHLASMKLVDEVTRYPSATTDDCVMAQWFLEWNLPRLGFQAAPPARRPVPKWLPKLNRRAA